MLPLSKVTGEGSRAAQLVVSQLTVVHTVVIKEVQVQAIISLDRGVLSNTMRLTLSSPAAPWLLSLS